MLAYLQESISQETIVVGRFLTVLLDELGIPKKRFVEYIDMHSANLSSLLRGRRKINTQTAIKLDELIIELQEETVDTVFFERKWFPM